MVAVVMAISKLNGPLPAWVDWTINAALPIFIVLMMISFAQIGRHRRPQGDLTERATPPETSQN